MKNRLSHFLKKHRTGLLYLLFGALTTLLSITLFWILNALLGDELYLISNLLSWAAAVIFAFITNKHAVFRSKSRDKRTVVIEIAEFIAARIFSLGAEELGLWILLDVAGLADASFTLIFTVSGTLVSKSVITVLVVLINYLFGKFIIFKPRGEQSE